MEYWTEDERNADTVSVVTVGLTMVRNGRWSVVGRFRPHGQLAGRLGRTTI